MMKLVLLITNILITKKTTKEEVLQVVIRKNYSKEKTAINTKNPNAKKIYAADDGYCTYFKLQ